MTKICFITNHGVAGDPVFEWLPRIFASHRDVFVYLGEGVRAKHFGERGREQRPEIAHYESFMEDVAGSYRLALEFYAYRAFKIHDYQFKLGSSKVINIIRNPFIWLNYYMNWRVNNLNQPPGVTYALDHEWRVIDHEELTSADLSYEKNDVERWSFFRGIQILNKMVSDNKLSCRNFPLESLYESYDDFSAFLSFLSEGEISIESNTFELSKNYEYQRNLDFRRYINADIITSSYEPWQKHALKKYWSKESRHFFETCGYVVEI